MFDEFVVHQHPFNATLDAAAAIRKNTQHIYSRSGPYVRLIASAQSSRRPKCAFLHDTAKALGAYIAEVASLTETIDLLFCAVTDAIQFNTDNLVPWLDTIASEYEFLVAHVDTLRAQGAALLSALDALGPAVTDALGYYPGAHFLIFNVTSPMAQLFGMGDYATAREAALRATPVELDSWRTLIRENDEIASTLESNAEEARRQFSVMALVWTITWVLHRDAEAMYEDAEIWRMDSGWNWHALWVH